MSWAAGHDPSKIRNMALVAHIDSGKTTLTESILLKSSFLSTAGSVDAGSTTTDFLPAERERGITIQAASIPVRWKQWTMNLIDTPGHADFGMEVESASRVVDGAVVLIDSVEGVEAQTRGVWRQLDRYGVPSRMVFLNKLDRTGASFRQSLLSVLSHRLHPKPMPLVLPVASNKTEDYSHAEPGIQGLVDLVKWEMWNWDEAGNSSRVPLPQNVEGFFNSGILPSSHPMLSELVAARTALLENLSMFSEELMEHLLELPAEPSAYLSVPSSKIMPYLRRATLNNEILPVLCGSAMKHIGTELVLDYAGELFASPLSIAHDKQTNNAPVRALAWKVVWDKRKGWMTFIRVYSGTLKGQSVLLNTSRNQKEKVSKLMLLYASDHQEVDSLPFGSVGVILGLKYTRTGDTLISTRGNSGSGPSTMQAIVPPPAVMSTSVIAHSRTDLEPVQDALEALSRTDPSVRVETHEGQLLVHGLGALHLEIVERRLQDEWGVRFEFGPRRVSYREGLNINARLEPDSTDRWNTEAAGKPVFTTVELRLRPLAEHEPGDDIWGGNTVVDASGDRVPGPDAFSDSTTPMANIARGLSSSLSTSPNTYLAMTRVHVQVGAFTYPQHVGPTILAGAAAHILRNRIKAAGTGPVMEPYVKIKITVAEDAIGRIVKDLNENSGEVLELGSASPNRETGADEDSGPYSSDGVYIPPDWISPSAMAVSGGSGHRVSQSRTIHALAPLSRMLDYSTRLRALSGGHGQFEMMNVGFHEVHEARKTEILREIGRL
ncbi:P-loop containing nucleoside triphosphate hydrolase protein [Punctularia strigosozonata HHB-11173 SS5]|uniref:P-loop containing nucleoside triphosphate hydrolase protein n=1 Tax=Punctularia strigosozonata (strain HHB-11173) TaxID=741275 RepID=UPI000441719D|nr:P-loop containing nucleoside triphosphate hydrolase protein [Punctularia strigosozonata HHB-11173 SS5]EIN10425.1 P-loop containing nucleoside triphosphate hydrolase protein [Punctularia strigosozonata HHB-11173 SS5]